MIALSIWNSFSDGAAKKQINKSLLYNSNYFYYFIASLEKRFYKRPTWLSFSICATKRGKRWTSVESFSVLTCLTMDLSSTSPSYAIGKIEVSLTEVWHRADITAARRRLLEVLKFASWISFKKNAPTPRNTA